MTRHINDDFRYLNVGLPEDILRRKLHGDFEGALRLIGLRLQDPRTPEAMRRCLNVERELIRRLPDDYPYSKAGALERIRADIADFTEDEFLLMVDEYRIDWIYVNGEERYFDRFYDTLLKVDRAFAQRAKHADAGDGEDAPKEGGRENLLDRTMLAMKREGRCGVALTIRASLRINDAAFRPGAHVRVHLPIPAEARQQSDIRLLAFSPEPKYIAPPSAPQRTAYWEETMAENHDFFVEYSYKNIVEYVDPAAVVASAEQPDFFTAEEHPHIVFTPYLRQLAGDLTDGLTDPVAKARAFYDFITLNVKYSYMREYFCLENIAENCARNFRGDCGVQALLFITLCRLAGIPARWQSGLCATPEGVSPHDWAEFYVAPHGWMFADPSFGGGAHRAGNEERRRFYFGNLDPYRMVANREFQVELDPPKLHWRLDPYDNQTGEIEYGDRGLKSDEYARSQALVGCAELQYERGDRHDP